MPTPELVQNQPEKSVIRKIAQRLPFISRLAAALMVVTAGVADHQPVHSQVDDNNKNEVKGVLLPTAEDTGVGQDYTATYTYPSGDKETWAVRTGTHGRADLGNNPNHGIDTIKITNSTNPLTPIEIQPNEALFPSDTNSIAVPGHRLDTSFNKAYVPVDIVRNSTGGGKGFPGTLIFLDAKNAADRTKQIIMTGFPQGGTYADSFSYFKLETDSKGKLINFGIQFSYDKREDGDYMFRLGSDGLPAGKVVKLAVTGYKLYLPISGINFQGS